MLIMAAAYYSDIFINLFMIVPKDFFLPKTPGYSKPIGLFKVWLSFWCIWQAHLQGFQINHLESFDLKMY